MIIYKLLRIAEWQQLEAETESLGAPIDLQDGYIHFSTKEQVKETASKHFAGVAALQLLACDSAAMSSHLKWEPSRGGGAFPASLSGSFLERCALAPRNRFQRWAP